eukprot:GHVO01057105.1.p1 GENE.GHVO01057105.1~~GHVO01057105.1.p1  ORF type:complete len:226 (+),score=20.41 GHVO01057105.1:136-813(+)
MIRAKMDKECKICARPYTAFRWQAGRKGRFKNTIVCQTCAKLKNVCQTCLFDLEFGLPVQVRDKFLADQRLSELPESQVNRDYMATLFEREAATGSLPYNKAPHPILQKLARNAPYYSRNKARVCSFWQRGECSRGDSCPFRHETDAHDPGLSHQNIKDRYVGRDDPVANKILRQHDKQETDDIQAAVAAEASSSSALPPPPKEFVPAPNPMAPMALPPLPRSMT